MDMKEMVTFCFQEATLSAIVITFYLMLSDWMEQYIDQQMIPKWQKYLVSLTIMFVASFVSITFILFLFGYKCHGKKK